MSDSGRITKWIADILEDDDVKDGISGLFVQLAAHFGVQDIGWREVYRLKSQLETDVHFIFTAIFNEDQGVGVLRGQYATYSILGWNHTPIYEVAIIVEDYMELVLYAHEKHDAAFDEAKKFYQNQLEETGKLKEKFGFADRS